MLPDFTIDSINILKTKKNLILIKSPKIVKKTKDYKSTLFGDLYQSRDLKPINKNFFKIGFKKGVKIKALEDLIFSIKVVKHLKSNAVVLANNKQTVGLGHGQTNRVDALKSAIKNKNNYFKNKSYVCASDGFFPLLIALIY